MRKNPTLKMRDDPQPKLWSSLVQDPRRQHCLRDSSSQTHRHLVLDLLLRREAFIPSSAQSRRTKLVTLNLPSQHSLRFLKLLFRSKKMKRMDQHLKSPKVSRTRSQGSTSTRPQSRIKRPRRINYLVYSLTPSRTGRRLLQVSIIRLVK